MGRSPCCSKEGLNRGAWTAVEDKILTQYIKLHGEGAWRNLPKKAGLKRCGKSCRLRWLNYLRPDIKRGNISHDEEDLIVRLHKLLGNRWSLIAGRLPGRTDNEIKNYWNTNLGKKVQDKQRSVAAAAATASQAAEKSKKSAMEEPEMVSQVIRTKASKCTRVVIASDESTSGEKAEVTIPPSSTTNLEQWSAEGLPSQMNSGDYMTDLSMEEFCLSDLLNSNFSDLCEFNYSNEDNNDLSGWYHDEANVDSNLISFASFIDLQGECSLG